MKIVDKFVANSLLLSKKSLKSLMDAVYSR